MKTMLRLLVLVMFSCKGKPAKDIRKEILKDKLQIDTVQYNEDSVPVLNGNFIDTGYKLNGDECFYSIFKDADFGLNSKNILIKNSKEQTVRRLIRWDYAGRAYASSGKEDIDNDGQKELWLRGHSGGAHCCDEWQVFLQQPNGKYMLADSLYAGRLCYDGKLFTYNFTEILGYFWSCYACGYGYEDSTSGFARMREIKLRFNKGKFEIVPYSKKEERQLFKNLGVLQKVIAKTLKQNESTSSMKKEFAMNAAVYYFNNQKNWEKTRRLFETYYSFTEKVDIVKEFKEYLDRIEEVNSF